MMELFVDGLSVQLRGFHDLSWLSGYGRVFKVFDQLTGGTLCFGLDNGRQQLYLRYAGAPTINYPGTSEASIARLRQAAQNYQGIRHAALVPLLESRAMPGGYLCIFPWSDGVPVGPLEENYALLRTAPALGRLNMIDALIDLHVTLEERGLVALGLSEAHLLYDATMQRVQLSSIDDYANMPILNTRGRTPGSPFYLAPECYEPAAALDETTTVYLLGALTHLFFGDRAHPDRRAWTMSPALYEVAATAMQKDRDRRYQSTRLLQSAWRREVLSTPLY